MKLINSALKYQPEECGSSLPGKILSQRRNKLVLIMTRMVGNVINPYIGRAHWNGNLTRAVPHHRTNAGFLNTKQCITYSQMRLELNYLSRIVGSTSACPFSCRLREVYFLIDPVRVVIAICHEYYQGGPEKEEGDTRLDSAILYKYQSCRQQ